jgi:hypothetical protein
MRYAASGPNRSCQPEVVNDKGMNGTTAFEPWSLSTVLSISSGAHDATARARERLAKILFQRFPSSPNSPNNVCV